MKLLSKKNSLQILPREGFTISQRWRSFSRGRDIIVWLAVADLLASLGLVITIYIFIVTFDYANNLVHYINFYKLVTISFS